MKAPGLSDCKATKGTKDQEAFVLLCSLRLLFKEATGHSFQVVHCAAIVVLVQD